MFPHVGIWNCEDQLFVGGTEMAGSCGWRWLAYNAICHREKEYFHEGVAVCEGNWKGTVLSLKSKNHRSIQYYRVHCCSSDSKVNLIDPYNLLWARYNSSRILLFSMNMKLETWFKGRHTHFVYVPKTKLAAAHSWIAHLSYVKTRSVGDEKIPPRFTLSILLDLVQMCPAGRNIWESLRKKTIRC